MAIIFRKKVAVWKVDLYELMIGFLSMYGINFYGHSLPRFMKQGVRDIILCCTLWAWSSMGWIGSFWMLYYLQLVVIASQCFIHKSTSFQNFDDTPSPGKNQQGLTYHLLLRWYALNGSVLFWQWWANGECIAALCWLHSVFWFFYPKTTGTPTLPSLKIKVEKNIVKL